MKVKYSALVSDMRGKLNGSVASKNRYGSYLRNKITPSNPQTAAQVAQRSLLAKFASLWRGLTEAQREAWNGAVSGYTKSNIFGDTVTPSGSVLFNQLNMNIATVAGSQLTLPPLPLGVTPISTLTVESTVATETLNLTITPEVIPANHVVVVEATAPMSPGIYNANNRFRIIAVNPDLVAGVADIFDDYEAKFGVPTVGRKAQFRVSLYRSDTGEKSLPLKSSLIFE